MASGGLAVLSFPEPPGKSLMSGMLRGWLALIAWSLLVAVPAPARAAEPETDFVLLEFDQDGDLKRPGDYGALLANVRKAPPTHIFLLAHGWNNSKAEARTKYERLLGEM